MRRVRKWELAFVLLLATVAAVVPLAVLADEVQISNSNPNYSVVSGQKTITIAVGGSATVSYYIQATSGDGKSGCNLTGAGGAPATVEFFVGSTKLDTSSSPVAANPGSLTFTNCGSGHAQAITFSSNSPGSYTIRPHVTSASTGGFDTTPAEVTLFVTSPPPTDATPPVITPHITGTLGNDEWYVSDVDVSWTVEDPDSTITSTDGCSQVTIDDDTPGRTLTCTATSAGGTNSASVTIKRDATPPQVTCVVPDTSVWYGDNVEVNCTASDATSGLANQDDDASFTLSTSVAEGEETETAQTGSRTVFDVAGNGTTAGPYTFKVDRKGPELTLTCPSAQVIKDSTAHAYWTASDGGSGVVGATSGSLKLDTSQVGPQELRLAEGFVTDEVGNPSREATCSYWVVYDWHGFFQPIDNPDTQNVVKAGSAVPVKFSLSGNQGLDIFESGYPMFVLQSCVTSTAESDVPTTTAGSSTLTYDPDSDQYIYVWKTQKTLADTCGKLVVKLKDGTEHVAYFKLK